MGLRRPRGYSLTCRTCAFREIDILPKTWQSAKPYDFMVGWCVHCLGDPTTPTPRNFVHGRTTRRSPSRS